MVTAKYLESKNWRKQLDLISDYTDIEIEQSDAIKHNSKYGKIRIQNVKT
jgi:hypothetical protein